MILSVGLVKYISFPLTLHIWSSFARLKLARTIACVWFGPPILSYCSWMLRGVHMVWGTAIHLRKTDLVSQRRCPNHLSANPSQTYRTSVTLCARLPQRGHIQDASSYGFPRMSSEMCCQFACVIQPEIKKNTHTHTHT